MDDPEFPQFPKDFNGIIVKPDKITFDDGDWKNEVIIENRGDLPILFKVKTTNNTRCRIDDCADVIRPKTAITVPIGGTGVEPKSSDRLLIVYIQYQAPTNVAPNAFLAWQRAKSRDIISKSITVPFMKNG